MDWIAVYLGTIAATFVISLLEGHRHNNPVSRLSILLGYMLVSETVGYYFRIHGLNHNFLFYIYQPIEYIFLSYLYAAHCTNQITGLWIRRIGWAFVVFSVVYIIWSWMDSRLQKDTFELSIIEWMLILGLVLHYFYDLYQNDSLINITVQPLFWISVGNFLFYSGTFFVMGLLEEVKKTDPALADRLFLINTFLNILLYTFWSIGFLCLRKSTRKSL